MSFRHWGGRDSLGLRKAAGEAPDKVDPESIAPKLASIRDSQSLQLGGTEQFISMNRMMLSFIKIEFCRDIQTA
jgi:hypothetical protein